MPATDAVGLRDGDHACIIFSTDEEHRAVIGKFLAEGVASGQRVLNIPCAHSPATMRGYLRSEGVDTEAAEANGQLSFLDSSVYTPDGSFDPDAMVARLMATLQTALQDGWDGMRGSGDMSWALAGAAGSDRIMEYEAKLNQVMPGSRFRAICQYDLRRFPPETLLEVLTNHPIAFVGAQRFNNFYYMPPEEYLSANRSQHQLERWLHNLHARRELEAHRQEAAVRQRLLERASAELSAKKEFINTAAHALATPLTPIGLQVRVLKEAPPTDTLAEHTGSIDILGRSFGRLNHVLDQLLEAVRAEGSALKVQSTDLCHVVGDSCAVARPLADAKGVKLTLDCPEVAVASMDEGAIRRVMDHLLANALRFTPQGGRIQVAVALNGSRATVTVVDTGEPIGAGQEEGMFQPFRQVRATEGEAGPGLGLGMYVSRVIVERHGGRMWGRDQGDGTVEFGFWVPLG